jgi:hypothetical protein
VGPGWQGERTARLAGLREARGKLLGRAQERREVSRARVEKEERSVLAGPRGKRGAGRAGLEAEFVFPISFPFLFLILLKLKSI